MKITKSLVRKLMLKCWNRAKRQRKHFNALDQLSLNRTFEYRFYNIEIAIKVPPRKRSWGMMQYFKNKNVDIEQNEIPCRLTVNPEAPFDLFTLENLIAHELAHFLDFNAGRESAHDFQFLHNYLLFSNKKYTRLTLQNFFAGYMMKNLNFVDFLTSATFKSYNKILEDN